jgi:hypothetical protein
MATGTHQDRSGEAATDAESSPPMAEGEASSGPPQAGADEEASGDVQGLSPDEADRIADSIRPSWELIPPEESDEDEDEGGALEAEPAAPAAAAHAESAPAATPKPSTQAETTGPVPALPGSRPKGRIYAIGGLVTALLVVGIVVAVSGGEDEAAQVARAPEASEGSSPAAASAGEATRSSPQAESGSSPQTPEGSKDSKATSASAGQGSAEQDSEGTGSEQLQAGEPSAEHSSAGGTESDEPDEKESSSAESAGESEPAAEQEPQKEPEARIVIRTVPRSATLHIDGKRVANPYETTVAASEEPHRIRAQAPGYGQKTRTVRFDQDRTATLRLQKAQRRPRQPQRREPANRGGESDDEGAFVKENPY